MHTFPQDNQYVSVKIDAGTQFVYSIFQDGKIIVLEETNILVPIGTYVQRGTSKNDIFMLTNIEHLKKDFHSESNHSNSIKVILTAHALVKLVSIDSELRFENAIEVEMPVGTSITVKEGTFLQSMNPKPEMGSEFHLLDSSQIYEVCAGSFDFGLSAQDFEKLWKESKKYLTKKDLEYCRKLLKSADKITPDLLKFYTEFLRFTSYKPRIIVDFIKTDKQAFDSLFQETSKRNTKVFLDKLEKWCVLLNYHHDCIHFDDLCDEVLKHCYVFNTIPDSVKKLERSSGVEKEVEKEVEKGVEKEVEKGVEKTTEIPYVSADILKWYFKNQLINYEHSEYDLLKFIIKNKSNQNDNDLLKWMMKNQYNHY